MADFDKPLLESDGTNGPLELFSRWYGEASKEVRLVEAVALATASATGRPSARMVLLKGFGADGFVFHTNYESRKGADLGDNPYGALLFYWDPFGRQVRIEGPVETLSAQDSDAYFASRPRGSQLSALASAQSRPIASRDLLNERIVELDRQLQGPVARPASWGGYRLRPEQFEFWQNREDRLHDRLRFRVEGGEWRLERLQP